VHLVGFTIEIIPVSTFIVQINLKAFDGNFRNNYNLKHVNTTQVRPVWLVLNDERGEFLK